MTLDKIINPLCNNIYICTDKTIDRTGMH